MCALREMLPVFWKRGNLLWLVRTSMKYQRGGGEASCHLSASSDTAAVEVP